MKKEHGNLNLYIKLGCKKIRDMKLKLKIRLFLFTITIATCIAIGGWSYRISRNAIIDNSEVMTINLMKQVGLNLDERISSFQDISYRILQISSIHTIIQYSETEAAAARVKSDNAFNTVILQQSSLYDYIEYAYIRPANGQVTEYYRARKEKKASSEREHILDYLEEYVSILNPTNWVVYNDEVYFVRRIMDADNKENGILCFAMTEKFFEFVGTNQNYLTNDQVVILSAQGMLLKNNMAELSRVQIGDLAGYKESSWYVYSCMEEMQGKRYLVVALNTMSNDWTVLSFISYAELMEELNKIFITMLVVILSVLIIGAAITGVISSTITRNVQIIEQGMKNYEAGRFDIRIKPVNYDEIGLLALQLNYMGLRIVDLIEQLEEEEAAKRELEYQALQAQINPHFLYNILGSLKWASHRRGEYETAQAMDAIINLLRFTIKRADKIIEVADEVDYIRNYAEIEKLRCGNAFTIAFEIAEPAKRCRMPGFILQPFLENALIHGLDMAKTDARVAVRAYQEEGFLILEVEDNGVGMSSECIRKILAADTRLVRKKDYTGFNSIGIKIVESRLRGYYGDDYRLSILSKEQKGTLIRISIPWEEADYEVQSIDCRR